MQSLKKLNQYLIENHPITWHSKLIPMLIAGAIMWILSYAIGYVLTDYGTILSENLSSYYSGSYFLAFHVIFCLIILCLWAINFYKNNAIRSFYPLQRFYLLRLFLQLFVSFTLLVSAYYPFTWGSYAKVRHTIPQKEMKAELKKSDGYNPDNYYREDYKASNYSLAYQDDSVKNVYAYDWGEGNYIGCLYFGFILACLFLLFEFTHIVSFLISIPVGGVVIILVTILLFIINTNRSYNVYHDYHSAEKISVSVIFFVMLAIVAATVSGIYNKQFNKRILNILFNLTYIIAPAFINMFLVMINTCSGHLAGSDMYGRYVYDYDFLMSPILVLVYAFTGLVCFLPLVKKWRAQEE